jgi:hypothetical protein
LTRRHHTKTSTSIAPLCSRRSQNSDLPAPIFVFLVTGLRLLFGINWAAKTASTLIGGASLTGLSMRETPICRRLLSEANSTKLRTTSANGNREPERVRVGLLSTRGASRWQRHRSVDHAESRGVKPYEPDGVSRYQQGSQRHFNEARRSERLLSAAAGGKTSLPEIQPCANVCIVWQT